jgi:K+-transporting ATPase KdpF subunit
MSTLVWIAGALASALLVYLVIALLLPEKLQ